MSRRPAIGRFGTRKELENRVIDYVDNGLSLNKTARNCEVSPPVVVKIWEKYTNERKNK